MKTIVAATTKRVAAKMKEDRDIILNLSFSHRLITTETLALKLKGRIKSYHIRKDEEVLGLVTKNYFFPRCGLATQILRHRRSRNKDPEENGLFPYFSTRFREGEDCRTSKILRNTPGSLLETKINRPL